MVTFRVRENEARSVTESLNELGFAFGPSRAMTTTLLDTFDGRLHRAGLRLQVTQTEQLEVVLSGEGIVPAHLAADRVPRDPANLPHGPLRSRIAALTGVRALMPQLRVSTHKTRGVLRDATGKVVAIAELHEGVHFVDWPDVDFPEATMELHELPGYSKPTRRALDALRRVGVAECDSDTLTQCATAAGVDLAGFTAAATVPLDPEMSAIEGFRLVLANLTTAIAANWQGTIDQSDPEFLHDLRIAVRRTRTVLAEAKSVLPVVIRDPARDGFSWLANLTGTPRDLDVYLLEWSHYTDPLGADVAPLLGPVRELLERRRAVAHLALERALRSERAAELMDKWRVWLSEPLGSDDLPPRADDPLGRMVAKRIARAHDVLLERGRLIGPDAPAEQVHDLRKDAKKLRYLLECFGSLMPDRPRAKYVGRLKALQDNLGEHQDAEVHVSLLRGIAHELHEAGPSPDTMVAIGQLTERLDQQRLAARAEFAERFADYDTPVTQRALDAVLEGITT
ncbi:MAG: CHAD domain-containing protein [Ilumatobacteraceae bacterium]